MLVLPPSPLWQCTGVLLSVVLIVVTVAVYGSLVLCIAHTAVEVVNVLGGAAAVLSAVTWRGDAAAANGPCCAQQRANDAIVRRALALLCLAEHLQEAAAAGRTMQW